MDIFAWLASLGTPREGSSITVSSPCTHKVDLNAVKPFRLTDDEVAIRKDWASYLNTSQYMFKLARSLPRHFKIGSVIFLWDSTGYEGNRHHTDVYGTTLTFISYIDGVPEYDNGECSITRNIISCIGSSLSEEDCTFYNIKNKDLFMYIMDNLDKVVDCECANTKHLRGLSNDSNRN